MVEPRRSPLDRHRIGLATHLAVLAALAVILLPATALAEGPDLFTRLIKKGPFFSAIARSPAAC